MQLPNLKYPPLKYDIKKHFPNEVITHIKVNTFEDNFPVDCFMLGKLDKQKANQTCVMVCKPSKILNRPSLEIETLISNFPMRGLGTKMLNFAQIVSKRSNCLGNFHLLADSCYSEIHPPHIFYKKYGMSTGIEKNDKQLDEIIKNKQQNTKKLNLKPTIMFYPPIKELKKSFEELYNINK